jgi:hypothetical protein
MLFAGAAGDVVRWSSWRCCSLEQLEMLFARAAGDVVRWSSWRCCSLEQLEMKLRRSNWRRRNKVFRLILRLSALLILLQNKKPLETAKDWQLCLLLLNFITNFSNFSSQLKINEKVS